MEKDGRFLFVKYLPTDVVYRASTWRRQELLQFHYKEIRTYFNDSKEIIPVFQMVSNGQHAMLKAMYRRLLQTTNLFSHSSDSLG